MSERITLRYAPLADNPSMFCIRRRSCFVKAFARTSDTDSHCRTMPSPMSGAKTCCACLVALAEGTMNNGLLILALQWLALNRHQITETVRGGLSQTWMRLTQSRSRSIGRVIRDLVRQSCDPATFEKLCMVSRHAIQSRSRDRKPEHPRNIEYSRSQHRQSATARLGASS